MYEKQTISRSCIFCTREQRIKNGLPQPSNKSTVEIRVHYPLQGVYVNRSQRAIRRSLAQRFGSMHGSHLFCLLF